MLTCVRLLYADEYNVLLLWYVGTGERGGCYQV